MLQDRGGAAKSNSPKKMFAGVRFVLFGFDSVSEAQYRSELVDGGGVDVGRYDSSCTHVVVSGRVFDEPVCIAARNDGKFLVTELWIDDSLSFGMLADSTKVLYWPPRDLSGIPGSESLYICLTGYQRQERDDIMRMVSLMGGRFSKPLIANQVTHLICYKFEGEKYELARKVNIKLVNHRWLEDCLKAWEILPIDSYNKSGWELEMLEAKAMDSEEEVEDPGKRITEQRNIAESHSLRGEVPATIGSGSFVDSRNLGVKKNSVTAKPSDLSVNNQLISTPQKENCSGKATEVCDTVLELNFSVAEQLPVNHGMGIIHSKQPNYPDLVDISMKCNGLPSNVRNSLVDMTSCEEDTKLVSLGYSRRTTDKIVSSKEQINYLCTPDKGKPEVNKRDVNISSTESKDEASKKCIYDNLHSSITGLNKPYVEGQTRVLSKKRKLSVSKINSNSIKSDQDSRTSVDAPRSINSTEPDFLKPQHRELENTLFHNETSTSICHMVEDNDSCRQMERLPVSSTCPRSPGLTHHDLGTCTKQSPSTSMRLRQMESMNAPQYGIDHGLSQTDGFECTSFVQPRAIQHGLLSNSGSLTCKRKFLKHWHSASVANISSNSSSMSDNKGELLGVFHKPALDETVYARDEPVSGVGTMYDITSPEAMVPSDCLRNNGTGQAEDRSTEDDSNLLQSPLAGDSENANEAPINVRVLEAPLESTRKSEANVKSLKIDGVSIKCKTDIDIETPEQHGKPGENQEDFHTAFKDTKVKGSVSTEIPKTCKNGKANNTSILCNRKVLVSRNMGCRPKPSRGNCKNKSSSDSLRSINSNETAIKLGNGLVESGDVDSLEEKVEKEGSPMKVRRNVKQCYPPSSNSNVFTLDTNHRDREKENELKDSCNLLVKEVDDCSRNGKKICKSNRSARRSSGHNIISLTKLSSSSSVITETMWFILSGHQTQRKEFQKIIRRLRGRICKDSHSWVYEATHFIVPDFLRRTQKFFAAAAAGRWILKSDYLTASGEAGKFLNEEPFEWHKKGLTEDGAISLEAPRKWRTLKERTGHGAFYGMRIIIYGECITPPLDTMKRAVKAGDGTILATSPPYTRFLSQSCVDFAIVNPTIPIIDPWIQEFFRHEIPCVLPDYLVEFVCKPGYSLDKHVLYNTIKWAEKSSANLLSRSEEIVSDEISIEEGLGDIKCVVCGSPDREEVMLICGDEDRTRGCGVGTHIDCCDPPLVEVPEDDWFCSSCSRKANKVKRKKNK